MAGAWKKIGRRIGPEGTTITYAKAGVAYQIESRKRHIPHANGIGTWDHTTFWTIKDGQDVKQFYALLEAKKWAEEEGAL